MQRFAIVDVGGMIHNIIGPPADGWDPGAGLTLVAIPDGAPAALHGHVVDGVWTPPEEPPQ
jgi:hypothetical protein